MSGSEVVDPNEVFLEWQRILKPKHRKVRHFLPKKLKEAYIKGRYLEDATANVLKRNNTHFIREQFVQYRNIRGQVDFIVVDGASHIVETKYTKSGEFKDLWFIQTMIYSLGTKINDIVFLYGNDAGFRTSRIVFNPKIAKAFAKELITMLKPYKHISAGTLIGYHKFTKSNVSLSVIRKMLNERLKSGLIIFSS